MDNIQLYYIDNEINKIDEMKEGDVIYKNGDEIILDNTPARQGEIWTDERSTHDEEYFSIEDHNSAIVLPKGTIRRLTGRDLKWEDDPISLKSKSVIDKFPHADIEFYKQKIINFVEWI